MHLQGAPLGLALLALLATSCGAISSETMPSVARLDPNLSARIVRCEPLFYAEGADDALDRPAHVRAASGVVNVEGELVLVQDDANFIAVRRQGGRVDAIALPAGPGGRRRFESALGNKNDKLDLEAAVRIDRDRPIVLGIGSGSLPARERFAIVDVRARSAHLFDASALYAELRSERAFSGSELNVEGAVVVDGALRLFQRGNGAPSGGLEPVNATCDLPLPALLAFLDGGPPPELRNIQRYDLGRERGVPYSFTDATLGDDGKVFVVTSAEDSPDAIRDGEVLGTRIGVLDGADVRFAPLLDADGPSRAKVEGIAPTDDPRRLHAVIDQDDPSAPALLCDIELDGVW